MNAVQRALKYGLTKGAIEKQLVTIDLFGHKVKVHKKAAHKFEKWVAEVRLYERKYHRKTWVPKVVQTYNYRKMRGSNSLSRHAYGLAVDIDPAQNGMVENGKAAFAWKKERTNIPSYVRASAKKVGLTCGFYWESPFDPMHFEESN
jgi:hypothetical protein